MKDSYGLTDFGAALGLSPLGQMTPLRQQSMLAAALQPMDQTLALREEHYRNEKREEVANAILEEAWNVLNFYGIVPERLAEWKRKEDEKAWKAWKEKKQELEHWLASRSIAERAHVRHVLETQY